MPAYVSVEQYEANLARLAANQCLQRRGGPAPGPALLSGLLRCGRCGGHRMTVSYHVPASDTPCTQLCLLLRQHQLRQWAVLPAHRRTVPGRLRHCSGPVGVGPGRAGGLRSGRRPGRGRTREPGPDVASTPRTRRARRRPGPAPVPADRTGEPAGRASAGARLGDRPGRSGPATTTSTNDSPPPAPAP